MRFSEDSRWGMVVNPAENEVVVIDASTDELAHTIKVGDKPYQVVPAGLVTCVAGHPGI